MGLQHGLFLTLEGIDGSGKTTQLEFLRRDLEKSGYPYLILREPGGTSISEQIRQILLNHKNKEMIAETELLLFSAARAQLVSQVIKPALAENKIVICDRFFDSTTAYQGFGRKMNVDFIQQLNHFATTGVKPNLTFYFEISVAEAVKRLNARKEKNDRIDFESRDFMERTRQGYLTLAKSDKKRVKVIHAEQSPDLVYREFKNYLLEIINLEE